MNGEKKALFPIIDTPTSWKLRHPPLKFSFIYTSQNHNNGGLSGSHYYPDKWKCCGDMLRFSSFYILDFFMNFEKYFFFLLPSFVRFLPFLSSRSSSSSFFSSTLVGTEVAGGGERTTKRTRVREEKWEEKRKCCEDIVKFSSFYIFDSFFLWTLENIWRYINRALFFCKYW